MGIFNNQSTNKQEASTAKPARSKKSRGKKENDVFELDDGFTAVSRLRRYTTSPLADEASGIGDHPDSINPENLQRTARAFPPAHEAYQRPRPVYPLEPRFRVYRYGVRPAVSNGNKVSNKGDNKEKKQKMAKLEDIYPDFRRPCMRIDIQEFKKDRLQGESKFRKYIRFLRLVSRRRTNIVYSAEYQIDGITTLHSLQGDKESDTGVPDAIRKLRIRRADCY